ncbi:GNAT family N-acetyltransferase, partial [Streptomyces werraensis]|uniref:GNAT family N-acetyltransferase n=1 Tax=Streptomyces werraensis TaxID=68284 RepID=UPI0037FE0650
VILRGTPGRGSSDRPSRPRSMKRRRQVRTVSAWAVGTPWQRRGIATEAAQGLVAWLRKHPVHTVIAHIHPDHKPSAAVATAAGLIPTDQWHDGEIRWQLAIS